MAIFKDMLGSDETIFRNEIALDYSYVPKVIPYREKEQRIMDIKKQSDSLKKDLEILDKHVLAIQISIHEFEKNKI